MDYQNHETSLSTDRVGEVLLGVLEPRVEGGRLLGEQQVEFLDLAELFLHGEQALLALLAVRQQGLPARHHVAVAPLNGGSLLVTSRHQLVLQRGEVLDALQLEGVQSCRPGTEQCHGRI